MVKVSESDGRCCLFIAPLVALRLGTAPMLTGNPLWSGGATGPEGDLFALAVPILMGAAMWAWWGRGKVTTWKAPP